MVEGETAHVSRQDKLITPAAISSSDGLDVDSMLGVNIRLRLTEVADREAELLRVTARRPPHAKQLRQLAKKIYDARRLRDCMMEEKLFGEPGWDMLLALYHLPALGHMLTVSSLCYCSGVPQTTALRWQKVLESDGLIERVPHETDGRMKYMRLTDQGRALMDSYLSRLFDCDASPRSTTSFVQRLGFS